MVSNVSRSSGMTPQKILILNLVGILSYILYPFFKSFQHWSFFHMNRNQSEKHQGNSILVIKGEVRWPGDSKGHGPTQQIWSSKPTEWKITGYDSKMMKGDSKTKWDTSRIETRAISCSPKLGQNFESIAMFIMCFLLSFRGFSLLLFSVAWKNPWRPQPLNHCMISYSHHLLMKYHQPRISYSCRYSIRPLTDC